MTGKYYVFRYSKHGFMFKRTKCGDQWASDPSLCWQYTKKGAEGIVEFKNERRKNDLYTYDMIEVDKAQAMLDEYDRELDRQTYMAEMANERPHWI